MADGLWRFLNSGFHSGVYNMRLDETLAQRLVAREGFPTLRVYGWMPHAISLGYNQRCSDFDEALCASRGIDVVRRPTGGRAIFHAEELTYSITMSARGKNINESYCEISRALLCGLRLLGADVEYAHARPDLNRLYKSQGSIPCFASSTQYEIQHHGRKLVGSAQRRYSTLEGEEVILQHGSVLLGPMHKRLPEFMRLEDEKNRTALREELERKTTDLGAALGRAVSFDEAAAALKEGFEREWNVTFTENEFDDLMASHATALLPSN
ncbi:MAG TPA: lipoate--protein ligase family protein [Bacteroidota bacterium]|nr:lipoate--protein ligase family protein [Bacteroidota bacterium]